MPAWAAAAAVARTELDCGAPPVISVSAPCARASASKNSIPRILFPPNPKPVRSSRLIHSLGPPIAAARRGASISGVGKCARGTRGMVFKPSSSRLPRLIDVPQFCQYLVHHRAAVTGMLPVVKEGFYLISGEMYTNLSVVQNGLLESTARGMRDHGGLVNARVRTLLAHPRRQCQHHGLGEHEASGCFQVGLHAVGVDHEVCSQCAQQCEQLASRQTCLG